MKFDSHILIGWFIGMTLIFNIFLLDFRMFKINAINIMIGIVFTIIMSNLPRIGGRK